MVDIHSTFLFFFFNDTATTEIYTLSLHDALPILLPDLGVDGYLQGHEEESLMQSAREHPEHRAFPVSTEHLAPCRAQPGEHLRQPQAAMMSIAREPGTPDGGGDVIQSCPQSRVPERVADVELRFVRCARQMAIELCPAWNPRIAVDAKLLEGNEVGPEVAFFESADLRSEEHTSELQSPCNLVCRLLLEKKKQRAKSHPHS